MIKYIKLFFANLIIFLLLLVLSEIFLRLFFPNLYLYSRSYPGKDYEKTILESKFNVTWPKSDSLLGWTCKPFNKIIFTNSIHNDSTINYTINSSGFRNNFDFDNLNDQNNVLMLGDSFLFGVYLRDNQTISSNLLNEMKVSRIINLGVPGYGIDQMYLSYLLFRDSINCEKVILIYIDDDLKRSYESYRALEGMYKPSFEIFNGELLLRKNDKMGVFETIFSESYLLNRFYLKYSEWNINKLNKKIFSTLRHSIKSNNQELYVFRIPRIEEFLSDADYSRYSLEDFFEQNGFHYYDLANDFRNLSKDKVKKMYLHDDGHLSNIGAKLVASIINDVMKKF